MPISGSSAAGGLASPTGIVPIYHAAAPRLQLAREVVVVVGDGEAQQAHRLGVGADGRERERPAADPGAPAVPPIPG